MFMINSEKKYGRFDWTPEAKASLKKIIEELKANHSLSNCCFGEDYRFIVETDE